MLTSDQLNDSYDKYYLKASSLNRKTLKRRIDKLNKDMICDPSKFSEFDNYKIILYAIAYYLPDYGFLFIENLNGALCSPENNIIYLDNRIIYENPNDVREVIYHEIAHAKEVEEIGYKKWIKQVKKARKEKKDIIKIKHSSKKFLKWCKFFNCTPRPSYYFK